MCGGENSNQILKTHIGEQKLQAQNRSDKRIFRVNRHDFPTKISHAQNLSIATECICMINYLMVNFRI